MNNRVLTVVIWAKSEGVQLYGMYPGWKPFCDIVAEIFGTGFAGVTKKKVDLRELPECMKEGVENAYLIHFDEARFNDINGGYYILESKPLETWYG